MNQPIYLDNAATTALDPLVIETMLPLMQEQFGNPSSSYSIGRNVRTIIEGARRKVAGILGVKPNTIYFTSGGTESNNTAILAALNDLGCTHIISSPIEHHAVLHTVEHHSKLKGTGYSFVALLPNGEVDYADLEMQLEEQAQAGKKCLVTLMHANNEIGSLLDIKRVGGLCKNYNAIFHSDCVQTIGHYALNLLECGVHFVSAAGHKFHGPKGTGILYVSSDIKISPLIYGGSQERNMRAGTENTYGIAGFARALELAMENHDADSEYIIGLNNSMREKLKAAIPNVMFNNPEQSLYTVLSVCFPESPQTDMLLMHFDMAGICVSGGSACSSGDDAGSHVIKVLNRPSDSATVRFSFSKNNTIADVEKAVAVAHSILAKNRLTVV